ncbi:MAG: hypothetical protein HUJ60_02620 [Bacilli bacterium]|nr:hypothetical protein [Bacilli bacterium]
MHLHETELIIHTEHCSPKGELRIASLLRIFQEIAISGVTVLGFPREDTIARGLFWVIGKQRLEITRLPKYGETIKVQTYPGKRVFHFFQRHTRLLDADGNVLVKGNALWALVDIASRKVADPAKLGFAIPEESMDGELPFPSSYPIPQGGEEKEIEARWGYCDLNGHLNNAAYLDVAEDLIPLSFLKDHTCTEIDITYKKEIPLGEKAKVTAVYEAPYWHFHGENVAIRLSYK